MFKINFCLLISLVFISTTRIYTQSNTDILGTWMSRGYGWAIEVNSKTIRIYDTTKISCTPNAEYPIQMLAEDMSVSDNVLSFSRGITTYTLDRISELPDLCAKKLSKRDRKNPELNFEVLWNTFNDHYVYFDNRKVDWQKSYEKYRPAITQKTTQEELFVACYQMLEDIQDGHVSIDASENLMKRAYRKAGYKSTPDADFKGLRQELVSKYLKQPKSHNLSRTIWGKITDHVGYVQINGMAAQGNYGIRADMSVKEAKRLYYKTLNGFPDQLENEVDGMNQTMKKILNDLEGTEDLILDLRFNGGGDDAVSLAILSYFTPSKRTVFTKKERIGDGYGPERAIDLTSASKRYQGKLHILQSHWSASATEILLLSSLSLDGVQRIGSPSEGIFSDILDKKLPNGWEFGLSNQVYEDNYGVSYEAKGIPVHIDLNYPKDEHKFVDKLKTDVKTIGDTAIESVLKSKEKK